MIYQNLPQDTASEELSEQKDLEELLKSLPQILQELEKENTNNCR